MELQQQARNRSHEWINQRSLAMDKAIASKLRAQPELLQRAKETLQNWIRQRQPAVPQVMLEWQEILTTWPFDKVLDLLTCSDQGPARLRQSSPFCGILTQEERMRIFQEYESLRA